MFLKFSELAVLDDEERPFSTNYGATASCVLTEFLSIEEIVAMPIESLVAFLCQKGKNRFTNPDHTAALLKQAARNSYRLDQCLYEPLTISLASSFNCISAYEAEIKSIIRRLKKR